MTKQIRIAIWARVSKEAQDPTTQLEPVRELAANLNGEIVKEYVEKETGRGGKGNRHQFEQMLQDASRREFDVLLFYRLERFSREGIRKTMIYLQQLESFGVSFKSHQEPFLDTQNELISHVVIAMLSYLAEYEAVKISENTKRKLADLKSKGVKLGRPSKFRELEPKLRKLHQAGESTYKISKALKISYNTAKKYIGMLDS